MKHFVIQRFFSSAMHSKSELFWFFILTILNKDTHKQDWKRKIRSLRY